MTVRRQQAVDFGLYLITDRNQVKGGDLIQTVAEALEGGVKAVQLREKDLSSRELFNLASALRKLTSRFGARLFINDRADIAQAVAADGVHLGGNSIPLQQVRAILGVNMLIGVSCHDQASAINAQEGEADFITCGPVFHTPSKAAYGEPLGTKRLAEVVARMQIPVFGLGGISRDSVPEVLASGAHGIALISAVIAADSPRQAAAELLSALAASHS